MTVRRTRPLARLCLAAICLIAAVTLIVSKGNPADRCFSAEEKKYADGTFVTMRATISEKIQNGTEQVLVLKASPSGLSGRMRRPFKCRLYDRGGLNVRIGDLVQVSGELCFYERARNPGGFDRHFYNGVRGISGKLKLSEIHVLRKKAFSARELLYRFSVKADRTIRLIAGDKDGGVVSSMLLGKRMMLDDEIRELYRTNGIAHLLAISGLHLSLIGEIIRRLLKRMGVFGAPSRLAIIILLMLYIEIAGAQIALLRAFIMYLTRLGAARAGRAYDSVTALLFSAVLILIHQPFYLWDSSFQLSYGAVAALCLADCLIRERTDAVHLPGRKRKAAESLKKSLIVSGSVFVVTAPVLCLTYYEIAPFSILLNLVVIPLLSVILLGGAAGIIFSAVPLIGPFLARIPLTAAKGAVLVNEWLCRAGEKLPCERIVTGKPPVPAVAAYYAVLILIVLSLCPSGAQSVRSLRTSGAAVAVIMTVLCAVRPVCTLLDHDTRIVMLDIGQGDCLHIADGEGHHYLVDAGSSSVDEAARYIIEPYLLSLGISRLNAVFISHGDSDHINGLSQMLDRGRKSIRIDHVVTTQECYDDENLQELKTLAKKKQAAGRCMRKGDTLPLGKGQLECLGPPRPDEDLPHPEPGNEASMILRYRRGGFSMLFTGDVEGAGEEALIQEISGDPPVTVLKTAHHGSKNSTPDDFLSSVRPAVALISAGKDNLYGHPHKETLTRLKSSGSQIYCTSLNGAICIRTDGKTFLIE